MDQKTNGLMIEPQRAKSMGSSAGTPVISYLKLTNTSKANVYFKIDTSQLDNDTSVEPKEGVIQPTKSFEVAVLAAKTPTAFNFVIHAFRTFKGFPYNFVDDVWADNDIVKTIEMKYNFKRLAPEPAYSAASGMSLEMPLLRRTKVTVIDENQEKLLKAEKEIANLQEQLRSLRQLGVPDFQRNSNRAEKYEYQYDEDDEKSEGCLVIDEDRRSSE